MSVRAIELPGLPDVQSGIRKKPVLVPRPPLVRAAPANDQLEWLDPELLVEDIEPIDLDAIVRELSRSPMPPLPQLVVIEAPRAQPSWPIAVGLAAASMLAGLALALAVSLAL